MEQIQAFLNENAVTIFIVMMLVTLAIINWPYLVRRPYKDHDKKLKDIEFDSPPVKVFDPIRDCDGYKVTHDKPYDPGTKERFIVHEAPPKPIRKVPVEIKRTQPAKPRQMEIDAIDDDTADDVSKFLTQFVAQSHVTSGHSVSGGHTDTHHTTHKCGGSSHGHSYSHHDSHSCSSTSDSGSSSSSSGGSD